MKKGLMTELRRAIRAHALTTADLRAAYLPFEGTARRVSAALDAVIKEMGDTNPMAAAFLDVDKRLSDADVKAWQGGATSRDELIELATVLGVTLPKKLHKTY